MRIYNQEQAEFLIAQFGAVRFAQQGSAFKVSYVSQAQGYAEPKKDIKPLLAVAKTSRKYHWLKQYDSIALQQAVINLHQAFGQLLQPEVKSQIPAI